jgi:acetyl esterase/lipase
MDNGSQSPAIPLWPGGAPGSEDWTHQERESRLASNNLPVIRNVARPTLTPYLPDPATATGTAVVVCPGGAFHFLAIEHEGVEVARWLVERGVAAFVLRYRVLPTAEGDDDFQRQLRENMADRARFREQSGPVRRMAVEDGRQAMTIVRRRATEWGVDPGRIGMLGFSAGAYVVTGVALQHDAASRPDFAAPIYGAPWDDVPMPDDAAPLFIALASDDDMAVRSSLPLYTKWRDAGHPAELHIFAQGGHGFGMRRQGLPADGWIDRFGDWLGSLGLLQRPH